LIGFRLHGFSGSAVSVFFFILPASLLVLTGAALIPPALLSGPLAPLERAVGIAIFGAAIWKRLLTNKKSKGSPFWWHGAIFPRCGSCWGRRVLVSYGGFLRSKGNVCREGAPKPCILPFRQTLPGMILLIRQCQKYLFINFSPLVMFIHDNSRVNKL
jgi:hypothetical protein